MAKRESKIWYRWCGNYLLALGLRQSGNRWNCEKLVLRKDCLGASSALEEDKTGLSPWHCSSGAAISEGDRIKMAWQVLGKLPCVELLLQGEGSAQMENGNE